MRTQLIMIFLLVLLSNITLSAQEKYIMTSDSVKLHVKIEGKGPACLYLHGGPGSGSNWLEEFMGDTLEQKFQMIYLDQRGVGRSTSPKDKNYSLERMLNDFEEVRKSLGIKEWLTLGHSFGGILQINYAKSYPNVISGMLFINCTLDMNDSYGKSWLPRAMALLNNEVPDASIDTNNSVYQRMLAIMPILSEKGLIWKIFFDKEEDSWKMNNTYSKFESWNSDQSEDILEFDEYWKDFKMYTSEMYHPVLFYYGETDWAIGPEHYKGVNFPHMILWGNKVGHMPFLENKADLIEAINYYLLKYNFQ